MAGYSCPRRVACARRERRKGVWENARRVRIVRIVRIVRVKMRTDSKFSLTDIKASFL